MRKIIIIISILAIGIIVGQDCTGSYPAEQFKQITVSNPCLLSVRDSIYNSGNTVLAGDLTISGSVAISGTITIDSLISSIWFNLHNGVIDTISGARADIDDIDADSVNSGIFVGPLTGDVTGNCDTADSSVVSATTHLADSATVASEAHLADSATVAVNSHTADVADSATIAVDSYDSQDCDTLGTKIAAALDDRLKVDPDTIIVNMWADINAGTIETLTVSTTASISELSVGAGELTVMGNSRFVGDSVKLAGSYLDISPITHFTGKIYGNDFSMVNGADTTRFYQDLGSFQFSSDNTISIDNTTGGVHVEGVNFTDGSITVAKNDTVQIATGGAGCFIGALNGNATTASDVDTTGTDIAVALGDRQPLCATLTQWCACVESTTCLGDTVWLWRGGKHCELLFTSP